MKHKTLIKEISLGLMTIIIAVFFWFSVWQSLKMEFAYDTLNLIGWGSLIYGLVSFCLLLTFIGIFSSLARKKLVIYPTFIILTATPLVFWQQGLYSLFIVVSCFLMFIFYRRYCREETASRYRFSITRSTYFGQSLVVVVLLIAVALTYYTTISDQKQDGASLEITITNIGTNALNRIMSANMENYDPEMTLDNWLSSQQIQETFEALPDFLGTEVISEELRKEINESVEYQEILTEAEERAKLEAIAELREELLKQFEIEAEGTDTINSVMEKIVGKNVDTFVTPYTKFISPILAFSLFLVLRLLTPLYLAIARIFQWLIFTILIKSNFIIVKKEQKEAITVNL